MPKNRYILVHSIFGTMSVVCDFLKIAMVYVIVGVISQFITSHFVFRWRTALNDYYMSHWHKIRHIEVASQRFQEDTMRFADILENLGTAFISDLTAIKTPSPFLLYLDGLRGSMG